MKDETGRNASNGSQGRQESKLSAEEKALIAARLRASKARRRKMRPEAVSVLVDGVERSRFDLRGSGHLQIELAEGAQLIEIRAADEEGELLLGTHLISYAEEAFESSRVMQFFNNGRLSLVISRIPGSHGARALLTLTFKRRFQMPWGAFSRAWRVIRPPDEIRCRCCCETYAAVKF